MGERTDQREIDSIAIHQVHPHRRVSRTGGIMQLVKRNNDSDMLLRLSIVVVICALSVGAAVAENPSPVDPGAIDSGHPTGHVHGHENDTWPPQSRGIENVIGLSNPGSASRALQKQRRRADLAEGRAMDRPEVRSALGDRYIRSAFIEADPKAGPSDTAQLVYYSYSHNETVTVTLDKQRVRSVSRVPPSEYQPEITDEEIAQAEGIARTHFLNAGHGRVSELQAFGILAYKPTGKGFYDRRVIYMSFHVNNDAPPEFVAWVDLTSRRVMRARQER